MIIIGLTGQSGAGKGTVCEALRSLDIRHIDTDLVYHDLLYPHSPLQQELEERFGSEVISKNGILDRKQLASIVFADGAEAKLDDLNRITHKHILKQTRDMIELCRFTSAPAVVIDAPQLFESGFDAECDCTVAVIADEVTRLERIMKRDAISRDSAIARISKQHKEDFFRDRCDYIIMNNGSLEELTSQTEEVFGQILAEVGND